MLAFGIAGREAQGPVGAIVVRQPGIMITLPRRNGEMVGSVETLWLQAIVAVDQTFDTPQRCGNEPKGHKSGDLVAGRWIDGGHQQRWVHVDYQNPMADVVVIMCDQLTTADTRWHWHAGHGVRDLTVRGQELIMRDQQGVKCVGHLLTPSVEFSSRVTATATGSNTYLVVWTIRSDGQATGKAVC